ncbi:uncharacterized protein TNCV_3149001 [Trichonephila clavipes]|nr:uncharacterized protein TNCV_3149001 [Trichonephila clavipes]
MKRSPLLPIQNVRIIRNRGCQLEKIKREGHIEDYLDQLKSSWLSINGFEDENSDGFCDAEHQETQRNVSPSEREEDERGPMPKSAIKDFLKKWESVRAMVLEWQPNEADVSRVGDLYNDNAINYFRKILKKRGKQSTLDMFFNAP